MPAASCKFGRSGWPRASALLPPDSPVFNLFYTRNINIGDSIYYGQKENNNIGDLIMETLELFERKGGSDALINIRYMVPQYQSCIL